MVYLSHMFSVISALNMHFFTVKQLVKDTSSLKMNHQSRLPSCCRPIHSTEEWWEQKSQCHCFHHPERWTNMHDIYLGNWALTSCLHEIICGGIVWHSNIGIGPDRVYPLHSTCLQLLLLPLLLLLYVLLISIEEKHRKSSFKMAFQFDLCPIFWYWPNIGF